MILAQAASEYGGAAGLGALLSTIDRTTDRLQASIHEHPVLWMAAGVILLLWLFTRRS